MTLRRIANAAQDLDVQFNSSCVRTTDQVKNRLQHQLLDVITSNSAADDGAVVDQLNFQALDPSGRSLPDQVLEGLSFFS